MGNKFFHVNRYMMVTQPCTCHNSHLLWLVLGWVTIREDHPRFCIDCVDFMARYEYSNITLYYYMAPCFQLFILLPYEYFMFILYYELPNPIARITVRIKSQRIDRDADHTVLPCIVFHIGRWTFPAMFQNEKRNKTFTNYITYRPTMIYLHNIYIFRLPQSTSVSYLISPSYVTYIANVWR